MKFWLQFVSQCNAIVLPLLGIITTVVWLYVFDQKQAAWLVGNYGPPVVLTSVLVWIVAVDSRKRWPGDNWLVRLVNVMTFKY